jgi:amino-acid N-acetyltransferase
MRYKQANHRDLEGIIDLLSSVGLPSEEVSSHLDNFIVARDGNKLVGVVGIQLCGSDALLRSLAVHPESRNRGIARQLFQRIVASAHDHGVKHLYLLTTTIEGLCEKWGFRKIDRKDVPKRISNTAEFKGLCPKTAVCLYQNTAEAVRFL